MSTKTKAASICYLLFVALEAAAGLRYATASEIMPYHQEVTGMPWAELQPGVQLMFLGMIRLIGCLDLVIAVTVGVFVFVPLRRGDPWARWATPALCLAALVPGVVIAFWLASETGASTPRWIVLSSTLLPVLGFLLSGDAERGNATVAMGEPR